MKPISPIEAKKLVEAEEAKKLVEAEEALKCTQCGSTNVIKRKSGYTQCQDCNYLDRGDD